MSAARPLRLVAVLFALAAVFLGLRWVADPVPASAPLVFTTEQVVLVGVTGRPQLTPTDRQVLAAGGDRADGAQVGAVAVRPREVGDCAAAGWTTLGAGRRAGVDGLCDPQVDGLVVPDFADRIAAAAVDRGDAQLGTLARQATGCVAAVGPGAALAAARPDGRLASYATPGQFLATPQLTCPITLIDAGSDSDRIIEALSGRPDLTLIVAGIGPAAGSSDPSLQVVYRLGSTRPGWLTSASTRRTGVVTLTDLTRTLIDFGRPVGTHPPTTVDGSPLEVVDPGGPAGLSLPAIDQRLRATAALSEAMPRIYLGMGIGGGVIFAALVVSVVRRRPRPVQLICGFGACLTPAMALTGATGWSGSAWPAAYALGSVFLLTAVLTVLVHLVARRSRTPMIIWAVGLGVAVFTADAALGGPLEPGSLLNSRPVNALRWYGFGNSTFASYATPVLVLAGYLAFRYRARGRRVEALLMVALIGFGAVLCEGWPSMGADFGGVIALTPAVVWLLWSLSGVRLSALRLTVVGAAAVVAVGAISVLDWTRGPDRRSHLGNFVQRLIDGDAIDVVSRKAEASVGTILSWGGLVAIAFGVAVWWLIFRVVVPAVGPAFATIASTMAAVCGVAVLGTVLNDAGIWVGAFVSAVVLFPALWFWSDTWSDPDRAASRR